MSLNLRLVQFKYNVYKVPTIPRKKFNTESSNTHLKVHSIILVDIMTNRSQVQLPK